MIRCTNLECKYCVECKCKSKEVKLQFCGVNTVNNGYQDYLKCISFEESEEFKEIKNLFKGEINGNKEML